MIPMMMPMIVPVVVAMIPVVAMMIVAVFRQSRNRGRRLRNLHCSAPSRTLR